MVDLTFQKVDARGQAIDAPMTVKYAPAELTFAKGAPYAEIAIPGLELPVLQFVRGEATTLSMDLFFDSIKGSLHHPPLVRVTWGDNFPGASFGESEQAGQTFTAAVLSVSRRFTLFNPDGKPLRAVVSLSLKQFATVAEQVTAINYKSSDHTRL